MSKQLYEEALADVRKVKEVAEANAQRAIIEAVTPRIRDLIENELLREVGDLDDDHAAPGSVGPEGQLMTDELPATSAITPPDEEGKVTLDLDALAADSAVDNSVESPLMGDVPSVENEYELNLESISTLSKILKSKKSAESKINNFESTVSQLGETIEKFKNAGRLIKESSGFDSQIDKMIQQVEDMYGYVQESVSDPAKKNVFETKLELYFTELNKLREHKTMSQKTKKMMNEEDVTLKLTGLPDDVDLDSVGVDLITGDEEEGDLDLDGGDEMSADDMSGGDDLEGLDMGGDETEELSMGEALTLSDDTIVEIDSGMLRREIAKLRKLSEEAVPSVDGHGVSANVLDDFGGGSDEGDPRDQDIEHLSPAKAAKPLGEADDSEDEKLEELDELDQVGDRRTRDDFGASATSVPSADKSNPAVRAESLRRRAEFEAKLQERAKVRAASIKKEVAAARASKNTKKESLLRKEYATVAKRFNESVTRSKNLSKLMAEAKNLQKESNQNGDSKRSAESTTDSKLRSKLAETNLINAKLLYTNKLLQNESLTSRQKAQMIEQLDSAETVREAKLVYESLSNTLSGASKSMNESSDRSVKVRGSSSRAVRPASTQTLNEGYEAERWARLAGISK